MFTRGSRSSHVSSTGLPISLASPHRLISRPCLPRRLDPRQSRCCYGGVVGGPAMTGNGNHSTYINGNDPGSENGATVNHMFGHLHKPYIWYLHFRILEFLLIMKLKMTGGWFMTFFEPHITYIYTQIYIYTYR